jgi:hypothetical protein
MAFVRFERIEDEHAPTLATTVNLYQLAAPRPGANLVVPARRIIFFSCRVITAGTTTAAVSFGTTTGGVSSIMASATVAATVAGRKIAPAGADLAGNSIAYVPGAAQEFITATYTIGAVHPVIRWCAVILNEDVLDKLLVA